MTMQNNLKITMYKRVNAELKIYLCAMLIKFSKQQTTYFAGGNNLTIIYMLQSLAGPKQNLSSHSKCFFKVSKAHKH